MSTINWRSILGGKDFTDEKAATTTHSPTHADTEPLHVGLRENVVFRSRNAHHFAMLPFPLELLRLHDPVILT